MKKIHFKGLVLLILFGVFISCNHAKNKKSTEGKKQDTSVTTENYRPNFHFTPQANWMNDPNGMFYYKGTYHLFFQYYPKASVWGPMHWGHATSKDLITWQHQPVALKPDSLGYIFSGSAVVDKNNTSGFGTDSNPPIIAIFTYHDAKAAEAGKKNYQSQAIAYSLDEGKTWTKYKNNPVIANPGIENFRDPKVTRDTIHKQWLLTLAVNDKTLFYSSQDLKKWRLLSEFGKGIGGHGGVWECPDFFPIQVENTGQTKWILIQNLNPGGYNGGSGTQYFVGDFDGKKFTLDKSMKNLGENHSYWVDFGKDDYAGVTWANIPKSDGRKLFLGWMSNWLYAQEVPTKPWRSTMTIPRELSLKKEGNTYRLFSEPVKELNSYITNSVKIPKVAVNGKTRFAKDSKLDYTKAVISFDISLTDNITYEFFLGNIEGDTLKFGYNQAENSFYINRKKSGIVNFNKDFASTPSSAPRISNADTLKVKMVLDKTSIELFYDHGETVMTEIFFPNSPYTEFGASSKKAFTITNLELQELYFNKN